MKWSRFCAGSVSARLLVEARAGETHAVLVLLDLDDAAVLEGPAHHVRLAAGALDVLGLVDGGPELVEVGQLDEVPHVRELGADNGALDHLVGGGDALSAVGCLVFGVGLWWFGFDWHRVELVVLDQMVRQFIVLT